MEKPRPLYGLDLLATDTSDKPVLIVEGEKAADAGRPLFPNMIVMTWPGGSSGVGSADWRPMVDRKIVIWPDHDAAGKRAALQIGDALSFLGVKDVSVVEIPDDWPTKWDVADDVPVTAGKTPVDILNGLIGDAIPLEAFNAKHSPSKTKATGSVQDGSVPKKGRDDSGVGGLAIDWLIQNGHLDLGSYDEWIRFTICWKNTFGEAGFGRWLAYSKAADGFESEEGCRKTWDGIVERSGNEPRLTIATYIARAQAVGWVAPRRRSNGSEGGPGKNEDLAAFTVNLVEQAGDELWLDHEARPHVTYVETTAEGIETKRHLPIQGSAYEAILQERFFDATGGLKTLKPEQADGAAAILAMRAKRSGVRHQAFLRVAELDGRIYVDLGTADGVAIEIDAQGWRTVAEPPVRFVRGDRGSLPIPQPGGTLGDFAKHFNVAEDDLIRLVGFMVGTFNVTGSYAILMTDGEQGSCKSTLNDKILGLTDPPHQPKSGRMSFNPKEQDLHIMAQGVHVLSFDNVSTFSADAADMLCRVATGGASGTRELYSNDRFKQFVVVRPVILTSIGVPSGRPDLLDRSVRITAQPVGQRRTERAVQASFDQDRPRMLGFLFSCVSTALKNQTLVDSAVASGEIALPRMADFASFVEGAYELLGLPFGGFSKLLHAGQSAMQIEAVTGSPIGAGLIRYFSGPNATVLNASARDLLRMLKESGSNEQNWPAASAFSRTLKRVGPGLRQIGIEYSVEEPRGHDNV